MRKAVRTRLIEALESGRYHQGRGLLKHVSKRDNTTRHCVIGVLCELYIESTGGRKGKFIQEKQELHDFKKAKIAYSIGNSYIDPPYKITKWAGSDLDEIDDLITMNDKGLSFKSIAKALREVKD